MKKNILRAIVLFSIAFGFSGTEKIHAQNGQPHSLKADVTFSDVTLSWKKPTDNIILQWHDDEDYNGMDGVLKDPEGSIEFYAASKFSASELAAYAGQTITDVRYWEYREAYKASVVIFEDGTPVYEQAADLAGFEKNSWRNVKFDTPYTIPEGKEVLISIKYSYGRNLDMVAICDRAPTYGKGNLYSYDGETWHSDGPGDFLITAVLANNSTGEPKGYNVYRDGEKVNGELIADATSYTLNGETDGQHEYQVSAVYDADEKMSAKTLASTLSVYGCMPPVPCISGKADNLSGTITWGSPLKRGAEMTWSGKEVSNGIGGKKSDAETAYLTYTLPEEYKAPTIVNNSQDGKNINIAWSSNAYELKHYSRATYIAGFAEEMPLLYGARFTKEELAEYAGFKFHSLTFGLGDNLDEFKLKIIAEGGEVLYEKQLTKNDITPGYLYTLDFDGEIDIKVPEGKDIYLAYEATLPANTTPILLDAGPEAEGGAVVNLSGGAGSWLNLSTIASDYKGMNVVIGALIIDDNSAQSPSKVKAARLSSVKLNGNDMERVIIKTKATTDAEGMEFGICTAKEPVKAAAANADKPKVKSYRIYRNGDMLLETTETSYAETLTEYGIIYYYVTSVYENGWESPASDLMTFRNTIAQRTQAPYDLRGAVDGKNLNLTWKPVSEAPVLTYENGSGNYMAFGMTGSNVVEGYMVIKFPAAEMADKVGQEISHINFRLNSTDLQTAAAVVMYGDNVVYMQDINVSTLNVGANTVRLNKPVKVIEGKDIGVGYHLSYMSGVKPLVCDDGPTVADYYSDLISASGTPGYWKSMNKDYKFNYNWAISATIKAADQKIDTEKASAPEADGVTYTVYRDGMPIQTGLTATSFVVENAVNGIYTVTATTGEDESAESNSVEYGETTGITSLTDDGSDSMKKGDIYTVDGQIAARNGDTSKLKKGVYIMNGKKFVVK